ncbi:hypothetical protein POPTR_001G002350v4 [Populus trichocarpa]|uniref:Uncharacterized protein n=1 Tax=Populus trichocarpa TaxID=3694 RepID=A0ACC0TGR3_POPTR|nr:hypothetical protein BDE02_01G002200 [Populus trichocarpa]KAI9400564.1 hypothetical protein POPTR_001G002350v4 [Populus trichocarpa]
MSTRHTQTSSHASGGQAKGIDEVEWETTRCYIKGDWLHAILTCSRKLKSVLQDTRQDWARVVSW